jgi:glycosyltransferase involved in cell wall biosynthesis
MPEDCIMSEAKKKLKVLMVGGIPSDLQSVKGGVEAVILNLFAGFSHLPDVEVAHIAFDKSESKCRIVQYAEQVKVYFVPFRSRFPLVDYLINQKILRKIIGDEKPDIIHIQESEPHLLRFLNYSKQNIVVTQHGIMREELKYAKGLQDNLKFLFKTLVERFVFPRFKNVIFISHYNKKLFIGELNFSKVIYNPVSLVFFKERPQTKPEANSIVYVGVINRRKNIRVILEALHQLKQEGLMYHLHVVGGYKEEAFESEVNSWVKEFGLAGQIIFHGWRKQEEILNVFDQCEYFVLPSKQETLPMSVAEAMALGKIVMASDVGAVSEMFENKITGFLFERDNVGELVGLLKGFSSNVNPDIKDQIKKEAIEKYDPIEVAKETVGFYRMVKGL